jgi:hypothetical protein
MTSYHLAMGSDPAALGAESIEEFVDRWDKTTPEQPSKDDPKVIRVEVRISEWTDGIGWH